MQTNEATPEINNAPYITESDARDQTAIGLMRTIVEQNDLSSKEVDNDMIRRFLRACDMDTEKASTLFLKYLKWKREMVPNGSISVADIPNELALNQMFQQGHDKKGRPILVFISRRHLKTRGGLDELKRFLVYSIDKAISRMPLGQERLVLIIDLEGWRYSNLDIRACQTALFILQEIYPERLGKLFMINAPYIFMAAWKVIYTFINSRTRQKIIFVEKKKLKPSLLDEIDDSQLAKLYGGKLTLVPVQDS